MASASGHVKASPGAWLAVTLIVISFTVGTFALTTHLIALWIVAGVFMLAGIVGGFASKIMEQAY